MRARWLLAVSLLVAACRNVPLDPAVEASPAWLAGTWRGERDGSTSEEFWTPLKGDLMLGGGRVLAGDRTLFFEQLRIEGPVLTRHGWRYVAAPRGVDATAFELVELGVHRLVFENKAHDWPQRILYRLESDGRLHARVEGEQSGVFRAEDFVFERVD